MEKLRLWDGHTTWLRPHNVTKQGAVPRSFNFHEGEGQNQSKERRQGQWATLVPSVCKAWLVVGLSLPTSLKARQVCFLS